VGSNVPALYPRYFVTTDGEMLSFADRSRPRPGPRRRTVTSQRARPRDDRTVPTGHQLAPSASDTWPRVSFF
jgi:hypothetical protein